MEPDQPIEELEDALQRAVKAFYVMRSASARNIANDALRRLIRHVARADRILRMLRVTHGLDNRQDRD